MERLVKEDVFVIEHRKTYGPVDERETEVELMAAFHEEYRAEGWLRDLLEDDYGWNLLATEVVHIQDGKVILVREPGNVDHRYEIKKGELLINR